METIKGLGISFAVLATAAYFLFANIEEHKIIETENVTHYTLILMN